ncbi:MAG: glycosyltransferase family 61 protein [Pseudomonadota bacterium]
MTKSTSQLFSIIDTDFSSQRKCSKWSLLPVKDFLRRKVFRKVPINLESVAEQTWELAPSETSITPPAYFLPNQLERITSWLESGNPWVQMAGGIKVTHTSTRGFLLKNAWLIDGVLYKNTACSYLHPRSRRWPPQLHVKNEIDRGAVFCSETGNRYFAHWLMDDCLMYPLAAAEGIPVTTNQPVGRHVPAYENWLDMTPTRLNNAFFKELVIFSDRGQNQHRHARFNAIHEKLLSHVNIQPHPGVFILRGNDGSKRHLINEMALAEYMHAKRGFRILDITKADVANIVATCAGAQVVMGVEGSQLIHGILTLPPGGAILTLQPPNRFVDSYKLMTDRDRQHFGFVVGIAEADGFRIDPNEVERTLDLFPKLPD